MSLYESWVSLAYDRQGQSDKKFWKTYMPFEQSIYGDILKNKTSALTNSVSGLAKQYGVRPEWICGFLDGIKDALEEPAYDSEELEEDTEFSVTIDFGKLFRKMVEYRAEHLASLPEWDNIFTEDERNGMYKNERRQGIYVRAEEKTGRNDPCPCKSGKKYKQCCGKNQ